MNVFYPFLHHYGLSLLFMAAFLEQAGLPIPATPIFLAAGAFAGTGEMNVWQALLVSIIGCTLGDVLWYFLGIFKGQAVLRLICRISIEPDTCVRQTEERFLKRGYRALVFSKFIPGIGTAIRPLAAIAGVPFGAFLFYDGLGTLLYVGSFVALGFVFREQADKVLLWIERAGRTSVEALVVVVILYLAVKQFRRMQMRQEIALPRIGPEELLTALSSENPPIVIDLRTALQVKDMPQTVMNAQLMEFRTMRHGGFKHWDRMREIVFYCACPHEATSAHAAQWLHHHGFKKVRPLLGGIDLWKEKGFPMIAVETLPAAEWGKLPQHHPTV